MGQATTWWSDEAGNDTTNVNFEVFQGSELRAQRHGECGKTTNILRQKQIETHFLFF